MQKLLPRTARTVLSTKIAALVVSGFGAALLSSPAHTQATGPCVVLSGNYQAGSEPVCGPAADGSTIGGAYATSNVMEGVAIGHAAKNLSGPSSADNGQGQTAVGANAATGGTRSTAFGYQAAGGYKAGTGGAPDQFADYATAVGALSEVTANGGTALGERANVSVLDGTALGRGTTVTAAKGVALGAESVADRGAISGVIDPLTGVPVTTTAGAVSVGTAGMNRQIINVANGTADTDAVNVQQVKALRDQFQVQIGNFVSYDDASKTSVTFGGVGATTPVQLNNVAAGVEDNDAVNVSQLKAVESKIGTGTTLDAVIYDNADHETVTLVGKAGSTTTPVKITNVAAGVDATDAVNFGQLTATNKQVDINTTNIANNTANIATNTSNIGKNTTDINTLFADALLLDPTKSFYNAGSTGKNLRIQNLAPGVAGTDGVNLDQLNAVEAKIGSGTTLDAVLYDDATHNTITLVGAGSSKTAPVKIKNVDAGTDATDAVNFGQLTATNKQVDINTTNIANNTTDINTLFADALLLDPTKSFYDAGRTGKNLRIQNLAPGVAGTDGVNVDQLNAVEAKIGSGTTLDAVLYDDANHDSITLVGTGGSKTDPVKIKNVDAGTDATDAVNFGQLTATNKLVDTNTTNIANNTTDISTLFADALLLDPTKTFYDSKSKKIQNVANGEISATSKDAVNGSQLHELQDQIGKAISGNYVAYDDAGKGTVTFGGVGAVSSVVLDNVAEGALSATSKQAVNGSQLFATNQQVDTNTTNITTLFNTALQFNGSYYDAGGKIIRNVATPVQGSDAVNKDYVDNKITNVNAQLGNVVKYDGAAKDTVTLEGVNGTKITNVADGAIAANSKDAINGGQLKVYGDNILETANKYTDQKFDQISKGTTGLFQVNVAAVVAPDTSGANSIAGGSGAVSSGANSIAIGNNSVASGPSSVALGTNAVSSGNNSVALGNGSNDGGRANVVAIGGRVVSNMADGVENSDGATVGQLRDATAQANNYTDQRVNVLHGDIDKLEKRSNAGIASAIALQAPANYAPGATTMRMGTGYYQKQVALGVSFRSTAENGRWSVTGGVSGGRYGGVAAGAGVEWVVSK